MDRSNHLFGSMVKAGFLGTTLLYLWLQSLFVQTIHEVEGTRHVFCYNKLSIALALGFNIIPLGWAWLVWRVKRDKVGVAIFLLTIPLIALFVLPQLLMERVEITPTILRHRREPPHTRYNADIAFDQITSVVEISRANGLTGYLLHLRTGQSVELPGNVVLTAASETINEHLHAYHIPVIDRTHLENP